VPCFLYIWVLNLLYSILLKNIKTSLNHEATCNNPPKKGLYKVLDQLVLRQLHLLIVNLWKAENPANMSHVAGNLETWRLNARVLGWVLGWKKGMSGRHWVECEEHLSTSGQDDTQVSVLFWSCTVRELAVCREAGPRNRECFCFYFCSFFIRFFISKIKSMTKEWGSKWSEYIPSRVG
jgi:hypothetical protein